jgi:dipeptidyl-peptidase-4
MKLSKIIVLVIILSTPCWAQNKDFTMADVVFNSYSSLAPERMNQLSWVPNSENLSFVEDTVLISLNSKTGGRKNLILLNDLNSKIAESKLGDKLRRFPRINWVTEEEFSFWNDTTYLHFNLSNMSVSAVNKIPNKAANREVANNNKFIAYTIDNDLFVALNGKAQKQITNEEDKGIVSGQSVSRNEFGISGGIFWSPKSNYLAFYQKDESGVTDFPLVDYGYAPAKLNNIKYPMAGQTSEIVKVGIYDIENDKTIWLKAEGEKDQYLTNVTWDPTEEFIYVAHLNRDQNHLRLVKYNSNNGEPVKTLFEEKDNEYVEPEKTLQFICPDENKFVWFSERDGWQHLYLYDTEGKLIKQITNGEWIVKSIVGMNKENHTIYFIGTKDSPIEDHLYKVDVKSGEIKRLTARKANHRITYNEKADLFIDNYRSLEVPSVTQIIDSNGKILQEIHKSKNPVEEYAISKPEIFTLKGEDDIELYSSLILPTEFDSTKKYPVVVYVYGGPHDQLVTNSWYYGRYDFWFQYMAQNGFIVFTLDNRGSANRGLEFEQAVHRRLGTKEIEDQLVGIEYLKSLSYVDSNRIGVYGWSYGGFMTTALMLRANDAFKVGVGGGAVIDWKLYEVMYGERYMDTPESNPEGYEEANLLNYVENLNGKLLLVHGTNDPTVVWENTLNFAKKAANLNKKLDYFPYVGHGHGVRGRDALHLYQKITDYFMENL